MPLHFKQLFYNSMTKINAYISKFQGMSALLVLHTGRGTTVQVDRGRETNNGYFRAYYASQMCAL